MFRKDLNGILSCFNFKQRNLSHDISVQKVDCQFQEFRKPSWRYSRDMCCPSVCPSCCRTLQVSLLEDDSKLSSCCFWFSLRFILFSLERSTFSADSSRSTTCPHLIRFTLSLSHRRTYQPCPSAHQVSNLLTMQLPVKYTL